MALCTTKNRSTIDFTRESLRMPDLLRTLLRLVVVVSAGALGACTGGPVDGKCENDGQCNVALEGDYRRCDTTTGECLCTDDRACGGDTCNAAGRCQPKSGCFSNKECITDQQGCSNQFCDTRTNTCLSVCECDPDDDERCCTLDSHCAFGQICSTLERRCIPGCRDDGDCFIGAGCVKDTPTSIGQCAAGVCTANNLCQFGEICDIVNGNCEFDARGPYCFSCTGGVASTDCGAGGNYCLTDTTDPTGQSSFCGVDCSQNQACPFGYECSEVIIVPQTLPFCSAEICEKNFGQQNGRCSSNTNVTCSVDEDCPIGLPGGTCPRYRTTCAAESVCPGGSTCPVSGICPPFGHCIVGQLPCEQDAECCDDDATCPEGSCVLQRCIGGEGAAFGHCTCTIDSDCPRDECVGENLSDPNNPIFGRCSLAGHKCLDDIDCDVIACVNGGCRIGANCAPANDRSCREIVGN
jgi:hypothetical protein